MNIISSLQWRYATKKFDDSKILSEDKLNVLKNAFNLTATSFGLQTLKMVIVKDRLLRSQLVQHTFGQAQVMNASHLLVLCIHENISDDDVDAHFDNVIDIRDTPETILAPYRADLKVTMRDMSKEERQEWSIRQAYIALGNLMTVCAVETIDSCPMEGFDADQYDMVLDLKSKNLKSVLLLPVGYRHHEDIFSDFKKVRKSLDETVIEM
ncbi:MAG: NAD(P)H-dependent oxidoreductase [Aquaticitalea sp.]